MKIDKIDKKTVEKISKLANLKIRDDEMSHFVKDFKKILQFLNRLNEPVKDDNVHDLMQSTEENFLRDDVVRDSLNLTNVFDNTKNVEQDFFSVPLIIKNSDEDK